MLQRARERNWTWRGRGGGGGEGGEILNDPRTILRISNIGGRPSGNSWDVQLQKIKNESVEIDSANSVGPVTFGGQ